MQNIKREEVEFPGNVIVPDSEFSKKILETHAMLETNQKYIAELVAKKRWFTSTNKILLEMQIENLKNYSDTLNTLPITVH